MSKDWFVVYTKPRHEKKSAEILKERGIDVFLPLYKKLTQWSDRKKWVEKPLFSGYLFVKIEDSEYYNVLNCKGIVRYIFFNGRPAVVREKIIDELKLILNATELNVETTDSSLELGQDVVVKSGPLKGLEGKLIKFKGKNKVAIEIECINNFVLVEIDKQFLN